MLKSSVIDYFGSPSKVAEALGIGRAAISKWGEQVPPLQAARLAQLTLGQLRFDADEYTNWYTRKRCKDRVASVAT